MTRREVLPYVGKSATKVVLVRSEEKNDVLYHRSYLPELGPPSA